jgi:hypothetical protein
MKLQKAIFYAFLFLVIGDALYYIGNVVGYGDNSLTNILLIFRYLTLFLFIYIARKSNWNTDIPKSIAVLFKIFLVWNILTIIRGAYLATDYWDYKFLFGNSLLFFLIPLVFFVGKNLALARLTIKYVLRYLFTFGFLLIPVTLATNPELYSRLMIPVSVLIVLIPYLKPQWRILVLVVAVVSIAMVIDFRSNILKTGISLILLMIYMVRRYIRLAWIKVGHALIIIIPIIFLILAGSGIYNVFAESSKNSYNVKSAKYGNGEQENLTNDTRTFLYVEVFSTLIKDGDMTIGKGATGKYKSEYFQDESGNGERHASEVGFLNIILYSGIIGLVIYALILFIASYYAIYQSSNFLCKMLGLLLICRWLLFFTEEFTNFDLNTFFTWLLIGLLCNKEFRSMTDKELKLFFRV